MTTRRSVEGISVVGARGTQSAGYMPVMRRIDPNLPFIEPLRPTALPDEMRVAPALPAARPALETVVPRRVLLINPFYPKDSNASFGKHVLTPTLALTSIAGATPVGWDLVYWDENLLQGPPPISPIPEVVALTVHLTFAQRAYEIAALFRALGSKVIMGGLHVMSCPEEVRPHADAVAIGDGVSLWPDILADVASGQLKREYRSDFRGAYRDEPSPAREILPRRNFLTTTSLNATRGCHNRCGFCYLSTEGLKMPYRMRDPEQIADEIRRDEQPYCVFTDNNLGSNRDYLLRLCRALEPLDIVWSAAVSIDVTDDPKVVRAMAVSGCTGVFVGFESLSDKNLSDAHKKTPLTEDYARRVGLLHDNGIQVNGSFVLGFDHDRRDVFATTAEWVEDNRLECATFHILTPYPKTPLFAQMESDGRLLHRDWSRYDTAHVVFEPKHMSPEDLQRGYEWMYQRLFSAASIWKRRPSDPRAVAPYLLMSTLYKRSNWLWHWLIKEQRTHEVWSPLVNWTRLRHLTFRKRLKTLPLSGAAEHPGKARRSLTVVSPSV